MEVSLYKLGGRRSLLKNIKNFFARSLPNVDLVLEKNEVRHDETIAGDFYIKGGAKQQKLKRLECILLKVYKDESKETVETVKTILMSRTLLAKENAMIPFTFLVSKEMEPSTEEFTYKLHTNLFFAENKVSTDHDELVIVKE
ncbi:sporulation protein [Cytobacillus oceanisediminis]|jgi:sporulation-control protein|nr:sporulation protein [Cytobacillus oceanisediminis]